MKPALSSFLFFAAACVARADFDLEHWQTRMPITPAQSSAVSTVLVDPAVCRTSRATLRDLRIVRAGREVPYRLEILSGRREQIELQPALRNKTAVPHKGLEAVLDLNGHPAHNRLRIATPQHNFKETVRIETSDDGLTWAIAREDGLIFDIQRPGRQASNLTIDYPVSTRRYVRLTISGWRDPAYLSSAWLKYFNETGPVRDNVSTITPAITQDSKMQTTSLTADIGFAGLAFDRLSLTVAPGLFSRRIEVSTSPDSKQWSFAGQGTISRTAEEEWLSIDFAEQWNRYLRVTVFNGDSSPLKFCQLRLSAFRRLLQFQSNAAGPYWLYSGNPTAKRPSYDLAALTPAPADAAATLGAPEPNPLYRKPWSDRSPHLLNIVLIAAAALMGFLTIRFLRKLKPG